MIPVLVYLDLHTHKAGDIDIETLISLRRERGWGVQQKIVKFDTSSGERKGCSLVGQQIIIGGGDGVNTFHYTLHFTQRLVSLSKCYYKN